MMRGGCLRLRGSSTQAQIDRAERGVDRDRRHFRNPAAEQHGQRRAGEETQARIECDLVETQDQRAGDRKPQQQAAAAQ